MRSTFIKENSDSSGLICFVRTAVENRLRVRVMLESKESLSGNWKWRVLDVITECFRTVGGCVFH